MGVQRYASPASAALWSRICDGFGYRDGHRSGPRTVYLSRSGQSYRKLTNETEVEDLFRSLGFRVVRPEELPIEEQVRIVAEAELIAGPGGSAMFDVAFQRHLKSVLIVIPATYAEITEWLFLAGTPCSVYYHVGFRDAPAQAPVTERDPWRVDVQRLAVDVKNWLVSVSGP